MILKNNFDSYIKFIIHRADLNTKLRYVLANASTRSSTKALTLTNFEGGPIEAFWIFWGVGVFFGYTGEVI